MVSKVTCVTLKSDVADMIKRLAEVNGWSMSRIVNEAVRIYFQLSLNINQKQ